MKAARCREQDTAAPELPCPYTAVFDTGACLVHTPSIRRSVVASDAVVALALAHAVRSAAAVRASFGALAEAVAGAAPSFAAIAEAAQVHSGPSDPVADSAAPLQMGDPPP